MTDPKGLIRLLVLLAGLGALVLIANKLVGKAQGAIA